jgi:Uma2 family endonuclease
MQAAHKNEFVSVADYLAAEEASPIRHEYLGGLVYAMAGETVVHNQISQNLLFQLRRKTKGGPGRTFISDVRVNFQLRTDEYYYYPDLVVTCDKRDTHSRWVQYPKLIIEVLSESSERVDMRENSSLTRVLLRWRNTCWWRSTPGRSRCFGGQMTGRRKNSLGPPPRFCFGHSS